MPEGTPPDVVRLGTRRSDLARWQTDYVAAELKKHFPDVRTEIVEFTTKGDKILDKALPAIGGKGVFTAELEAALRAGEIDLAVHSLKDLPTDNPPGLVVGAILGHADAHDALVSKHGLRIEQLPEGAQIGTSSRRRAAQLLAYRPDFRIIDIRGNVPTRIDKAQDPNGPYDAIVLAKAGIERLNLTHHIVQPLPMDVMLPAPGQGALGVQCRDDDKAWLWKLYDNGRAVEAERGFLNALEGGCSVPVAAFADGDTLRGRVISVDGRTVIDVQQMLNLPTSEDSQPYTTAEHAAEIGREMAQQAIEQGARDILEAIR